MKAKFILILLATTLTSLTHSFASYEMLTVITSENEFEGFRENYVDGVPTAGLEFDLMQEVCNVLSKSCIWDSMDPGFNVGPVPTILDTVIFGEYDIAIAFMRGTFERMSAAKASAPYLQTKVSIHGSPALISETTMNESDAPIFSGRPVRYAVVGAYEKTVKEMFYPFNTESYEIIKVEEDSEAIEKINNGEADATVASELKATFFMNDLEVYRDYDSPKNEQWGPRMYTSHNNLQLMRDVNIALKLLIDVGIYDQILARYGSTGREPCFQDEDDDDTINIVEDYSVCY